MELKDTTRQLAWNYVYSKRAGDYPHVLDSETMPRSVAERFWRLVREYEKTAIPR